MRIGSISPLGIARIAVLTVASVTMVFPVYWMIVASFRHPETIYSDLSLVPQRPSLENYEMIGNFIDYGAQYTNSVIVAVAVMLATMVLSTFVAYSIARYRFRGRGSLDDNDAVFVHVSAIA
jgi:multiple sugar transport system permease protein